MQPHLRTLAGALALAAFLPSTALAQNIATDVASGAFAPATVPTTIGSTQGPVAIIKSQQQARDAGAYSVLPPSMLVNWDFTQVMLLLAVDARTSGGGGVSISVEKRSMFGGFVPTVEWLDVKITRSVPAPGSPGITAATRPFALVKLAKTNALIIPRVVDVSPSPPAPLAFTDLTRVLVDQPASSFQPTIQTHTSTVQILANGQVTISNRMAPVGINPPPLVGTATQAELLKLSRAVAAARLNQIPIDLGTGYPQFTFRVLGLAGGDQKIQGVRGQEGQYKARLDAIHASVDAIRDRLRGVNPPTGLGFVDISRRTTTAPASSFVPQPHEDHEDLQVFASGVVKFSRWSTPGATGIPPVTGLATRNELRALSRAIIAADFNRIPRDLGNANPLYTFRVIGIAGGDRKIQGTRGQEGQYKARLDAVHAALDVIRNRLDNTTPPPPPSGLGFTSVEHRTTATPLFNPPPSFPSIPAPPNPILPGPSGPSIMMSSTVSTEVKADGSVTINRWSTPGPAPQPLVTGTATQAELKAVAKAVRLARFHEIPQDLGGFSHDTFSFRVIGTPQGDRKISGSSGSQGQYRDRLRAVEDALTAIRRRIEAGPPNGGTFDSISFRTTETLAGPNRTKVISIGQSGNVTVSQIQPGGPNFQPARGQASAADMAELRQLVQDARVADIPAHLIVAMPMHLPSKPFTLSVSSVQQQNDNKISGQYGYYGQYDARLRPLIAKVEAIASKVTQPPTKLFFEIGQATQVPTEVTAGEELVIEVKGIRPSTATLTEVETTLKSLETMPPRYELKVNAVGRHSLTTGDAAITRPFTRTIRVRIPADDGEKTVKVVFNTEFLNGSARFERSVDITPKADEARGIVESRRLGQQGRVAVWLVDGSKRTRVLPTSFARTLRKFEGHEVKVSGQAIGSDRIRANTLVSPVRQDIVGTVRVNNGAVTISSVSTGPWPPIFPGPVPMPPVIPFDTVPGGTSFWAPTETYAAFGPGAKVAEKAVGLRVTADAWVFENNRRPVRPTKAMIVGLRATVLEDSDLTRRGDKVNSVQQGQQVLVTRLSNSGNHAFVRPSSGRTGYMPIGKLELGDRIFQILPMNPPLTGNNPGLSNTLGAATSGSGN